MKKRIVIMLTAVMMTAALATACAKSEKDGGKSDIQQMHATEDDGSKAGKIQYDAKDCVTLGDYSALQISVKNTYEVTQEQIDDYARRMAEFYAQPVYKDTDKKVVENGDTVNIDYEGRQDGVAFEGGTAKGAYLTIGSGQFIDGFEEGLTGKKVGETVDLNLTFPDPYEPDPDMSGAKVVFTVTIHKIVEPDENAKVELTDEFVQANLNADSVKEYKKNVKGYLEADSERSKRTDTIQAVTDKLQEICTVNMPEGLLEATVDDYVVQFTNSNCKDTTLEEYLKNQFNGMTEEDFRKSITTEMEVNLTIEMILETIAEKEGIELEEDKFQEYVSSMMEANNYETKEESELFFAVMELPKKYRIVIHLFYYEDYSTKEISAMLGVKDATVRTRLARARKILRERLTDVWSEE